MLSDSDALIRTLARLDTAIGDYEQRTARLERQVAMLTSVPVLRIAPEPGCEDLLPKRAHDDDAGLDLCAAEDICIPYAEQSMGDVNPFVRAVVSTGLRMAIPSGYEGQVRPRSGHSRDGLVVVLGTVDASYRGVVSVIIENRTGVPVTIERGQRIAQLVIAEVWLGEVVVAALDSTERGYGGFGSTGV